MNALGGGWTGESKSGGINGLWPRNGRAEKPVWMSSSGRGAPRGIGKFGGNSICCCCNGCRRSCALALNGFGRLEQSDGEPNTFDGGGPSNDSGRAESFRFGGG